MKYSRPFTIVVLIDRSKIQSIHEQSFVMFVDCQGVKRNIIVMEGLLL